ncbi:MAG TPA: formimidoylglutamase [Bacteroidota bacterium]|nr:formimidoylglutamase [Bacteroidota bacterium]
MDAAWKLLTDIPDPVFFSRNDESDPRMGDIVRRQKENFSDKINVGIVGVPEDEGVRRNRGRVGAKDAPNEIRKALYKFTPYALSKGKQASDLAIFDFGNVKAGATLEETHERVQAVLEMLFAKNILPIVLGGGHDTTYPSFLAFAKEAASTGAINIDTHLCFRKLDPQRNNSTAFRQILDLTHSPLTAMNFVQVGAQSFANAQEHYEELIDRGATVFTLDEVRKERMEKILELAYEIASNSVERLYFSFDLDAVRGSDAPGVSASYPTGLSAEELLKAAHFAGMRRKTKAIDIVEVNPKFDFDGRTAKLAAFVIMYFLTGVANR